MVVQHEYEMPTPIKWLFAAVGILNVVAIIAAAGLLYFNNGTDASQTEAIKNQTMQIAKLVGAQHEDQISACKRGNDSRLAEIDNLQSDLISLKADLSLLRVVYAATKGSRLSSIYGAAVQAKELAIQRKRASIRKTIEAQAPVAVKRGSPLVDCAHKAYSLHQNQHDGSQGGDR